MKKQFAKKSLGQNFLNSTEIRSRILEAAGDLHGKNILEIGPGLGFLTTKLLAGGANLIAVEKDDRAVEILNNDFAHKENFKLINDDFLKQDLDELFGQKKYSIIANIPYNITNPILRKILSQTTNKPEFAILMVQKEVAEKICIIRKKFYQHILHNGKILQNNNNLENDVNKPFKRSILSISIEVFAESEFLFEVGRENFSPAPRVDSAIILLKSRLKPLISKDLEKDFFTVVNAGFSRKRKKIGNVLPQFFGVNSEQILGSINGDARAEDLSIDDWILITENFRKNVVKPAA